MQQLDTVYDSTRQVEDFVQVDNGQHKEYSRSSFDSVAFKDRLRDFDSKYVDHGRFGFDTSETPGVSGLSDQPTVEQLTLPWRQLRRSTTEAGVLQVSRGAFDQYPERRRSLESGGWVSSSSEPYGTDNDESSDASIFSGNPPASDNLKTATGHDTPNPRKRKREQGTSCSQPATPSISVSRTSSLPDDPSTALKSSIFLQNLFSSKYTTYTKDQLLVMPSKGGSDHLMYKGNDESFIQIAQILVDQIILASEALIEPLSKRMMDFQPTKINVRARFHDPLSHIIPSLFVRHKYCDLKSYTALGWDEPDKQHHDSPALRPGTKRSNMVQRTLHPTPSPTKVFKIEAPYTCVRRAGKLVELSSSALSFWEELGLAPASDSKDIAAFCIFPAQEYIQDGVDAFLSMMGTAYQSCKLGSHIQGSLLPDYEKGLVPVSLNSCTFDDVLEALSGACEKLGKQLQEIL